MSIRPIDPQSVLHKASESQRTHATAREQPNAGEHHFLQELEQQSTRKQQMVRQTDDAEANKLQADDQRKQQQREQERRRRQRQEMRQSALPPDRNRGMHLDIKV